MQFYIMFNVSVLLLDDALKPSAEGRAPQTASIKCIPSMCVRRCAVLLHSLGVALASCTDVR